LRRATTALLILVAVAIAAAAVLYVTKDWLVAMGVRVGIAQYNARVNSRLVVQDVTLELLTLTATVRGVSIAERGQTPLEAPIYVKQAIAKVRLWPLIRRQVVLDEVAVSGVNVRLEVDRQDRVNLEELFRLVKDDPDKPSPWKVILRRFTVDQAMANLVFGGQPVRASLEQMAFQGSLTVQPLHVHVEMLTGQGDVTYLLRQERLHYHLSQTAAAVDVIKKRLVIDQLRVDATEFTVTARGGIDNAQVAGQFDIDLDLATVAAFIPDTPPPVGSLTVRGAIDGPLNHPRLQLAAEGGRVEVGPYAASNLSTHVNLAGKHLQVERFALGFAGSTIQGTGTLDLASEHIDVQVDIAALPLAGLEPLAAGAAALVEGHVGGRARLVSPSFNLERMRVEGTLALSPPESPQQAARTRRLFPLPLALNTRFHFENRTLTLEQSVWALDGVRGKLTGTLSLDGTMQVAGEVAADLASQTFVRLGLPAARGEAKVTFESRGNLPEPRVKAALQLHQASYQGIPIESLQLEFEAEHSTVKIISLAGAQWGGRYQVAGAIDLSAPYSRLQANAAAFPIRAISGLRLHLEHVNMAKLALLLPIPVPLAGEVSLQAKGEGPWTSLRGAGQIDVRGLVVRGEPLGDVSLALEGAPTQVTLKRLRAEVGGGQILANGSVTLPRQLVEVTLTWQGVRLDQLSSLQGINLPLSGGLNGTAKVRGAWPDLEAGVTVQGPRLTVSGLEVADLQLQAMASPREIMLERLTTRIAGARLSAGGRVAFHGPIDIRLSSESIPLRGFALMPKDLALSGRAQLELTGSGTFESPRLRGQIQLTGVQAGGMGLGTGNATFVLDGRQMTFSTAGLQAFNIDGSMTLDATLPARIRLGMRSLDLGLLVGRLSGAPQGAFEGDVSGTVEVDGQLRVLPSMTGRITLDRLRMRTNGVELRNISPLRWQLAGGMLQFEAVRLQAQGANLDLHGGINLEQENLNIAIAGTSPLAVVGTRIPGVRFQQGMVNTRVSIRGPLRDPVFEGQALVQDGALYVAALNEHLSQLKGEIQFAGQTIAIQTLTGRFAGGNIAVSGEVRLQRFQLHDMSLTAEATQVRLRYPNGFFASLNAEIVATGGSEGQQITGEVSLGQARYRQELDLASLIRQFRQRALEPPSMAEESLQFDIRVYTRDPLRVENRLAKLQLATDLNVRGSPSRPVVLGHVDIEKGTADVGGSRFTSVSGSIDFLNPSRIEPFIDIVADTQKSGYQIHVMATGTPQQIDLHLTSEPSLAEPDILQLLTAGATGQAITTGVGTILPPRVSAFLTGQIAEEISHGVGGIVGIDRLDIEPVVGGAQRVGGPKVTVGKDVGKNLSVTYSTTVGSTLEDLVTIEYRLTDNISLLGVRDERGDVGVDVKFSLRFE
jgi:autotransporter translocation and assembly factor TamB